MMVETSQYRAARDALQDRAQAGTVMIWAAIALFALSKSIIHVLTDIGAEMPVDGRNPISFCNVLFVGNIVAAATLFGLNRRDWTAANLRRLGRGDWISLLVMGLISGALAPTLGFLALENTSVSNVVFLGRAEPVLFMILSAAVLGDRPDRWAVFGALASALGVAAILYLQGAARGGIMLGRGDLFAVLAAVTLAVSTILSKIRLRSIPFGIFCVVRMVVGAGFYFAWVTYWFGPNHFVDVWAPVLWKWMLIYGAVIVAGGQILFLKGINQAPAQDVSLATSFSPVLAVFFAFVLLGETPDTPVLVGGGLILAGIFAAQAGSWYSRQRRTRQADAGDLAEMEGRVTFRGV